MLWLSVCSGLPSKLCSREELCTLLSVAIFTASVQHAATNNGQVLPDHTLSSVWPARVLFSILFLLMLFQFDWCAWIPNTPCTMRQPPPGDKDAVTMETIMATLPDISQSCMQMAITWHLGRPQPDAVSLSLTLPLSVFGYIYVSISIFSTVGSIGSLQRGIFH